MSAGTSKLGLNLHRAQGCGGVGREVWIARPRDTDHDAALLEMSDRAATDVWLCNLANLERAHAAGVDVQLLERVLKGDPVDHRREHTHVIGASAIHSRRAALESSEDVSTADNDRQFDAGASHLRKLSRDGSQGIGLHSEASVDPTKSFAGQLDSTSGLMETGAR